MITRKENLVKGTCQANSILEINVTLLIAERPCLEEKAYRVKGLEHQWKCYSYKWVERLYTSSLWSTRDKGMPDPHGIVSRTLYFSIRDKKPPKLPPPPPSSPAQPCYDRTWWGIEHFCIWYISQKVNGEYFKQYVKLWEQIWFEVYFCFKTFFEIFTNNWRLILKWNGLPHLIRARGLNIKSVVVGHLTFH